MGCNQDEWDIEQTWDRVHDMCRLLSQDISECR